MKLSRFLELMGQSSQPDKEEIRKRILKKKKPVRVRLIAGITAAVIGVGVLASGGYFALMSMPSGKDMHIPEALKGTSAIAAITATETKSDYITTSSGFEITTVKSISTDDLSEALKIEPQTEYTVKKTSGNTFDITFDAGLQSDMLYTLSSLIGSKTVYSWAFQTEKEFGIKAVSHDGGYVNETQPIWVEFTHDVDNFEQYFSVTPSIPGTFEKYGKRWVFIPSEDFVNSTVYTVTVSKDIINSVGQTLDSDKSFSFMMKGQAYAETVYSDTGAMCDSYKTGEIPQAHISYYNLNTLSATAEVYSIASAEEFIDIHKAYVSGTLISGEIKNELSSPIATFDATAEGDGQAATLTYPNTFDNGYYVTAITLDDVTVYHFFEVTAFAVYAVQSNGECVLWVNDISTGEPLPGIAITADSSDIAATDKDGVAVFKKGITPGKRYIKVGAITPYVCIINCSVKEKGFTENEAVDRPVLTYNVTVKTDKAEYFDGDVITYTVYAELKDGTPAENVNITFENEQVTTNSRGLATFTKTAKESQDGVYVWDEFYVLQPEGTQTVSYACYRVYAGEEYIKKVYDRNSLLTVEVVGQAELKATLHKVTSDGDEAISELEVSENTVPYTFPLDANQYYIELTYGNDSYIHKLTGAPADAGLSFVCREEYSEGDTVKLTLTGGEFDGGKVFISVISDSIIHSGVYLYDNISFEFTKGGTVNAAYFDGETMTPIAPLILNEKREALEVEIITTNGTVSPGDTVEADITVQDSEGYPVKATVNVSVNDKKLMSARDGAYIADTSEAVYTEVITTDSAGKARVRFTLPSSITDWIITADASTENKTEGTAFTEVCATKALYITPFVSDTVDADSELSFALRFNGTENECNYTAVLLKNGIQIESVTGVASPEQVKNDSFSKQAPGEYKIQITGGDGTNTDTVEKEFVITEHTLTDIAFAEDGDGALVYDKEFEVYRTVLSEMLTKTSSRIDHRLARSAAEAKLYGKDKTASSDSQRTAQYFTANGINIYGLDSIATPLQAALITAVAEQHIDVNIIREYFDSVLAGYPDATGRIAAALAFGAMGEPVLDELKELYDGIDSYTDEQKLYLALGFAYAGDYRTAWAIYNDHLAIKILSANGVAEFAADTPYETEYMTCLAACLCAKLSQSDGKELVKGLIGGDDYTLSGLAFVTFIDCFIPCLDGKNSIVSDGEAIEYDRNECIYVDAPADGIQPKDGESVIAAIDVRDMTEYEPADGSVDISLANDSITDGDTFTLKINIDVSESDVKAPYAKLKLPHGLRLIGAYATAGNGYALFDDSGEIEIYFTGDSISVNVRCYAALEGEYKIHSPIVFDNGTLGYLTGNDIDITVQ